MRTKTPANVQEALLALHAAASRPRALWQSLESIRLLCGAEDSAIILAGPRGRHFTLVTPGPGGRGKLKHARVPRLQSLENWVYATGQPVMRPGPAPRHAPSPKLQQSFFTAPCLLLAALPSASKTRGVLAAMNHAREKRFTPAQAETLQLLARHIALALDHIQHSKTERVFSLELRRHVQSIAAQLRAANESLRVADEAKSELISTVAHELRSPITSISGFAKLLLKSQSAGALSEEQAQFCQIIFNNSEHLGRMIADLLDITKLEQGRLEMRLEQINLEALVKEAVLSWQAAAPEQAQRLAADAPGEPVRVQGDRMRLLQVMNNLISNALKYSTPGTPITLKLAADPGFARITVQNQGPQLTPQQLVKVFEKFYRIRNQATENTPGTGLGLAIAKSIIQAHGGTIWAQNAPAGGVVITFTLPQAADANPQIRAN
jgi:signal transduction histidine kinase